ncbi:MAG: hypothetical protein Q8P48_03250, partial [Deltaproteobacteria bacterium]|nr:hypothetical protein [Deltaproteobacteria bacterium]
AAAAVLSLAVLLSGSRGAVVSYFFMAALFGLFSEMSTAKKAVLSLLLLAVPFLLPARQIIDNILVLLNGQTGVEWSAQMRASYYKTVLTIHDPVSFIWGHGFENFRVHYLNATHSVWGQSLYELGIIGLGIQLYLLYRLFKVFLGLKGMKDGTGPAPTRGMALGLGISVFVLFFWGLFENVGLIVGSKHLFALIGAFLAASRIAQEGDHESSPDYA